MSPKRLSKIEFWIGAKEHEAPLSQDSYWITMSLSMLLEQSILDIAVFPTSDHTAPFSSFDSAPKTNILVQNEVPQYPRPVLVIW
jgi:hypothetical protein